MTRTSLLPLLALTEPTPSHAQTLEHQGLPSRRHSEIACGHPVSQRCGLCTTCSAGYVAARTTAAVVALPMGALVQIEALVSNGEGTIPEAPQAGNLIKIARNTDKAPRSSLPTQTVAFSHYNNIQLNGLLTTVWKFSSW